MLRWLCFFSWVCPFTGVATVGQFMRCWRRSGSDGEIYARVLVIDDESRGVSVEGAGRKAYGRTKYCKRRVNGK